MSQAGDRHRSKKKRCLALKRWRRKKDRRPNYGVSRLASVYALQRKLEAFLAAVRRYVWITIPGELLE